MLNDLNGSIVNLFTVIRTRGEELARVIEMTPWSESEYHRIERDVVCDDELEHARRFLVRCWQAHGGTLHQTAGWKHNGVIATVYPVKLWKQLPARLLAVVDRLRDAEIRCKPALELIDYYNAPDTLIYADPPYMLSTRARKYYGVEMTDGEHLQMLELLDKHRGPVVLSGYAHPLYDERLAHWQRIEMQTNGEHGKSQLEVVWLNGRVPVISQGTLL